MFLERAGCPRESREVVWRDALPILAQLVAEAALQAVARGQLVTVQRGGMQLIVAPAEAADQREEVATLHNVR